MPTLVPASVAPYLAAARRHVFGNGIKRAADISGTGMDSSFEQSFASLADAYLRDKAPSLLDYMIGFQLIDRDETGSKAVGVMGFKVGGTWLLMPVFFLDGDLKGHELLYIKNQDLFVPCSENWVNYLLNRRPHVLGKGVNRDLRQLGVLSPDLRQMKYPTGKYASAAPPGAPVLEPWAADFLPAFARILTTDPYARPTSVDLVSFLKAAGSGVARQFLRTLADYPALMDGIDRFYGRTKISETLRDIAQDEKTQASLLTPPPPAPPETTTTSVLKDPQTAGSTEDGTEAGDELLGKQGALHIIRFGSLSMDGVLPKRELVEDGDKEELIKGKVVIKDLRRDGDVTMAYSVDEPKKLQNPNETGLYEVLVKPNQFARCAVFVGPYGSKGRVSGVLVVRTEDKAWVLTNQTRIWVKEQLPRTDFEQWVKDLPEADRLDAGLQAILGPSGQQATAPFRVWRTTGGGKFKTYDVHFMDRPKKTRAGSLVYDASQHIQDPLQLSAQSYQTQLVLTGAPGRGLRSAAGELYVPKGSKSLRLDNVAVCSCANDSEPAPLLGLGNMPDFHLGILKQAGVETDVRWNGSTYRVNGGKPHEPEEAVVHLVRDHGLREKAARAILDEVRAARAGRYYFKYAAPMHDLQQGTSGAPPFPEPYPMSDPMTGGMVPTMYGQQSASPVPGLEAMHTNRSVYDPRNAAPLHEMGPAPDQDAAGLAMRAGQMGQKEVFDSSMIASLIKHTRPDSVVRQGLGGMMKTVDRMARILISLWWGRESFEEQYGKQELPALEDQLRDMIEGVGNLILTLREHDASPESDTSILPDLRGTRDESDA